MKLKDENVLWSNTDKNKILTHYLQLKKLLILLDLYPLLSIKATKHS